MRPIIQLAALQAIDTDLDADRKRYAEIQAELQPPSSLSQAQTARNEAAALVEQWRKEQQQRERAVADQSTKVQTQEKQLYSGRVKDPRELVAMQQNVEALKRHLETLEEAELEAILEAEQAESDLAEAEVSLTEEQAAWASTEAGLQQERQSLILRARKRKAQRDTAAADLPPADLKRYEALRERSGGVAVAPLQGAGCGGCGAALPTATRQQVHGDQIVTCPICKRMLVG
ncbi:MAG: hypothetical protein GY764_13860 [Halieaceae bacterium]|nr:hypothetical protein [Halieaceae bacterium]